MNEYIEEMQICTLCKEKITPQSTKFIYGKPICIDCHIALKSEHVKVLLDED